VWEEERKRKELKGEIESLRSVEKQIFCFARERSFSNSRRQEGQTAWPDSGLAKFQSFTLNVPVSIAISKFLRRCVATHILTNLLSCQWSEKETGYQGAKIYLFFPYLCNKDHVHQHYCSLHPKSPIAKQKRKRERRHLFPARYYKFFCTLVHCIRTSRNSDSRQRQVTTSTVLTKQSTMACKAPYHDSRTTGASQTRLLESAALVFGGGLSPLSFKAFSATIK